MEAAVGVNGPELGDDGPEELDAIDEVGETNWECEGRSMDGSCIMLSGCNDGTLPLPIGWPPMLNMFWKNSGVWRLASKSPACPNDGGMRLLWVGR
jgi:hypothetical protein